MHRAGQIIIALAIVVVAAAGAAVLLSGGEKNDGEAVTTSDSSVDQGRQGERPRFTLARQQGLTPVGERAGVRAGIAVYSDVRGTGADVRSIPFGQRVTVVCVAPNESGISTINAFYLISTPPWRGRFASANQFLNGTRLGETTNAGQLNPDVQKCRE